MDNLLQIKELSVTYKSDDITTKGFGQYRRR